MVSYAAAVVNFALALLNATQASASPTSSRSTLLLWPLASTRHPKSYHMTSEVRLAMWRRQRRMVCRNCGMVKSGLPAMPVGVRGATSGVTPLSKRLR